MRLALATNQGKPSSQKVNSRFQRQLAYRPVCWTIAHQILHKLVQVPPETGFHTKFISSAFPKKLKYLSLGRTGRGKGGPGAPPLPPAGPSTAGGPEQFLVTMYLQVDVAFHFMEFLKAQPGGPPPLPIAGPPPLPP